MVKLRKEERKKKASATKVREKVIGSLFYSKDEVLSFVKSSKYVTPYLLASKFGLKVSVARKILRDLVRKGVIEEVEGTSSLTRIYRCVAG